MTVNVSVLYSFTANDLMAKAVARNAISGVIVDSTGNLIFVDTVDGQNGQITELTKTANGYASAPVVMSQFTGSDGYWPQSSFVTDSSGNLYGVTQYGGAFFQAGIANSGYGTVYEISRTGSSYSGTPALLASFNLSDGLFPNSLVMDSQGNLFGTTFQGGSHTDGGETSGAGTIFEIAKTANGYAATPTVLANFDALVAPYNGPQFLVIDKSGDLFGTTNAGSNASVFELVKTANGYASALTNLATFSSTGIGFVGNLVLDNNGDLFGASQSPDGSGTIFEIAKTASGYASQPTTLINLPAGQALYSLLTHMNELLIDSSGDLFFPTDLSKSGGVIYELAKTAGGYADTLTTVYSWSQTITGTTAAELTVDSAGNLFLTTNSGGANGLGGISEITGSGYAVTAASAISANQAGLVTSTVTIGDTAADIGANLDGLQSLAAAGKLGSITLTDGGIPTVSLTATQLVNDAKALAAISSSYVLDVTTSATSSQSITGSSQGTTVALSGNESSYTITSAGDGASFSITNGTVTDHLKNVTAIQFGDQTDLVASLTPSVPGAVSSAEVANLYAAVLGRVPDVAGLAYYENIAATQPSTPFSFYAEAFLQSPEYTGNSAHNYAQTSAGDAQFVTDIYNNLLHRAPEAGAVQWYQANVINPILSGAVSGTAAYTAAELAAHAAVLKDFSQSGEFLGDVQVTPGTASGSGHWLILI